MWYSFNADEAARAINANLLPDGVQVTVRAVNPSLDYTITENTKGMDRDEIHRRVIAVLAGLEKRTK